MKFRIERDVLADVVTWVSRTLPSRAAAFPALAGVLVEAGGDGVSFTTTTQDTWSHNTADAVVGEPGTALISGRLLMEIARSLPAQPVSFALQSSGRVEVTCGAASFLLPTLPGEEYPPLPATPSAVGSVDAGMFAAAVAQVAVASASPDERSHAYSGIRMEIEPQGHVTLAATDRYRLAVRELPWEPLAIDQPIAVTVPGREFLDATKAFAGSGSVSLHLGESETSLSLTADSRLTGLRLMDSANFPKFRSLLPTSFVSQPEIEVAALKEALKRVSLVLHQDSPVRLTFASDEVVLKAGTGDEATATETIGCVLQGEGLDVAFNPRFLADGLAGLTDAHARLSLQSSDKAAVLTGIDPDGGSEVFRYLLMPVRLNR
ncbi:MAG: DNA polymerase III subunit beta [Candidatus Nanopelagicales bacterium]